MKIVPRYVLKEHFGPLVFALSALTSLLLLNFVAKKFGDLVGKGLPWSVIAEFLLLSVPFTLAMTLPMAVLVATLHAFSRFAAENEITAFKASGVSMQRLMIPVVVAAFGLTLGMVWFNDQVLPRANHRLATLQADIARVKPTLALNEQVINEIVRGQLYLRAARVDAATNRMKDVVIYDLSDGARRRTIVADSGELGFSASGEDLLLTLHAGTMSEVPAQEPERLQRNFYTRDMIRVRNVAQRLDRDGTRSSYRSDRELSICELRVRVQRADADRATIWTRLREAEGDSTRAESPPAIPGGMGALYCRGLDIARGMLAVEEARAAMPQDPTPIPLQGPKRPRGPSPAKPGPRVVPQAAESGDSLLATPQSVGSSVVVEGLRAEYAQSQASIDGYRVEIEKKFAIAFACVVFVLLGAPIALRFPRGGVGLTIGVSLGVFGLYYVGLLGGEALADRNLLDPAVAMWTTNAILGVIGLVLTLRLGNEGATSRGSETAEWWSRLFDRVRAFRRKGA